MFTTQSPGRNTHVRAWYSYPINEIRISSTPGGETLSIKEAKELRAELGNIIETAENKEATTVEGEANE